MILSQCPYCDHRCAAGAKFCSDCGAPLHLKPCPKCGRVTEVQTPVCDGCGTIFADDLQVADEPLHDVPLLDDQLFDVARMFEPAQQDDTLFGEANARKSQAPPELLFDVKSGHGDTGQLIASTNQALVPFPSHEVSLAAVASRPIRPLFIWAIGVAAVVATAAFLVLRPTAVPEAIDATAMPSDKPQPAAGGRTEPAKVTEPSVPVTAPVGAATAGTSIGASAATAIPPSTVTATSPAATNSAASSPPAGSPPTASPPTASPPTASLPADSAGIPPKAATESKSPADQATCAAALVALGLCPKLQLNR